jgi:hypothetical protein
LTISQNNAPAVRRIVPATTKSATLQFISKTH